MATYEYDIVIIGSGPNGLEIAAYMARAFLKYSSRVPSKQSKTTK